MRRVCEKIVLGLLLAHWATAAETTRGSHVRRRRAVRCGEDEGALTLELPKNVVESLPDIEAMVNSATEFGLFRTPDNTPGFDTFEVFHDIDDAAIVARRGNKCFAVFRPTSSHNIFDILQLYDWSIKDIGDCSVRGGIYKAYFSSYYDDFVAAVEDCMAGGRSELFLTGHSQAGAIAVVAAIDLKRHDPTTITFGATRTLVDNAECSDVNPERHFRFVNVAQGNYDSWPMQFNRNQYHVGHTILLDGEAGHPAAYVGLNDNTNRSPEDSRIHKLDFSLPAVSKLLELLSDCSKIRISSWEDGHGCSGDDECAGYCINARCS